MEDENIVSGFRSVVQDLLVPELKAIKKELEYHNKHFEKIDHILEAMQKEFIDLKIGQKEILAKIDYDKRVTKLEALVEQLLKNAA